MRKLMKFLSIVGSFAAGVGVGYLLFSDNRCCDDCDCDCCRESYDDDDDDFFEVLDEELDDEGLETDESTEIPVE